MYNCIYPNYLNILNFLLYLSETLNNLVMCLNSTEWVASIVNSNQMLHLIWVYNVSSDMSWHVLKNTLGKYDIVIFSYVRTENLALSW